MSQTSHQDLEGEDDPGGQQTQHDNSPSNPHPAPSQPLQPESIFGDSSGPLFSMYSKAAEEEDNRMVDRWQKDADGILIFTGLFSAAVAALLAVTVQDLRPNGQDTSAFYLGNIYQVLADPNVTPSSVPTPIAKPPPFSRPRFSVWVNSLWFLSLVMSLSCALWATSLHQWARRYIRLTQPARCSPEKRARIRAFFANGVDTMHVPWAVEGLPTLLHLSLFLFFGGLAIFLFNVDHDVFTCVLLWIVFFSIVYGLVTLLPFIRHDSPYNTPLSITARFLYRLLYPRIRFLYSRIQYLALKVHVHYRDRRRRNRRYPRDQARRYRRWRNGMERRLNRLKSVSVKMKAEESAEELEEQSPEVDVRILGWTISALGDDDSLEKFFEAIPGFFNSKLVNHLQSNFPETLLKTFWGALDGFMDRTSSSNSVTEPVKSRRDIIYRDIISTIPRPDSDFYADITNPSNLEIIPLPNRYFRFYEAPVSIERLQAMARWFTHLSSDVSDFARNYVVWHLLELKERDYPWIMLARTAFGLVEYFDVREDNIDDILLGTLIDVFRKAIHIENNTLMMDLVGALTKFDIRHSSPWLQHRFCTFWNELVQEAESDRNRIFLHAIHHLYITLHQGTDPDRTAFLFSPNRAYVPLLPYPLCDIARHYPGPTAYVPAPNLPAISLLTQPAATEHALPVHTSTRPTDASAPSALQDIPLAGTLSCPLEGTTLKDVVTPCAEPDTSEILSTASTPAPTLTPGPVPESTPRVPNETSISCDADAASLSNPLPPASSVVVFSVPASPPSRVPPLPNAELLALLDGTTPSGSIGKATFPGLRGLVNTGNMCFANAVFQLLVHSPLFWNLFKQLGDLSGQGGTGDPAAGDGAKPLVDATVRFFKEFRNKEKRPPPTQQPLRQAAGGKLKEDEEAKKAPNAVDSFEPTYIFDAMKEKTQLKRLLNGQQQDAEEFFRLYLDALDEELLALLGSISGHNLAAATPGVEEREILESDPTEVVVRGLTKSVESPLMQIFGGKFRSTLRAPNQPDTVTTEAWLSLQLDIQHDLVHAIEDALARITHLQPVQLGPSGRGEASQQVFVEVLPPILVLHLKRFLYDSADGIVKVSKHVRFAPELEIPLEIMAPVAGKSLELAHYKLYGVLYHHGESAGNGHYTVDVLHQNEVNGGGEGWLHIDDEAVSTMRQEDVFGGDDDLRVDDRCAYMLFYCRTATA